MKRGNERFSFRHLALCLCEHFHENFNNIKLIFLEKKNAAGGVGGAIKFPNEFSSS